MVYFKMMYDSNMAGEEYFEKEDIYIVVDMQVIDTHKRKKRLL